eukprot:1103454-Rhodomonas_salina.2
MSTYPLNWHSNLTNLRLVLGVGMFFLGFLAPRLLGHALDLSRVLPVSLLGWMVRCLADTLNSFGSVLTPPFSPCSPANFDVDFVTPACLSEWGPAASFYLQVLPLGGWRRALTVKSSAEQVERVWLRAACLGSDLRWLVGSWQLLLPFMFGGCFAAGNFVQMVWRRWSSHGQDVEKNNLKHMWQATCRAT